MEFLRYAGKGNLFRDGDPCRTAIHPGTFPEGLAQGTYLCTLTKGEKVFAEVDRSVKVLHSTNFLFLMP